MSAAEHGTRIHMAMEVYLRLMAHRVTYVRVTDAAPDDLPMTFKIEVRPSYPIQVHKDPYPGWKPPGNFHHRKGRR